MVCDKYVNENCYISINLFSRYSLKLGDWVFLQIHDNNNNSSNQCLISRVWTSRYILQDQYIQANPSIKLYRCDSGNNNSNNNINENIYSNLVSIHKINQFDPKLNEIDIKIIIETNNNENETTNNNNNNNNNNNINELKNLLYKKTVFKRIITF